MARVITKSDLENAQRLKAIYNAKKRTLELTQTILAAKLGMKQGAVAQYINGHIALNYNATIAFAKILQVDPWDIDPTLNVLSNRGADAEREVAVDVVSTLSGSGKPKQNSITIRYSGMIEHLLGFEADSNDYAPFLKQEDVIVVDRTLQPEVGDDVVVCYASGAKIVGELIDQSAKEITVENYNGGEQVTQPMSDIVSYDTVVSIKKCKKNRTRRIGLTSIAV